MSEEHYLLTRDGELTFKPTRVFKKFYFNFCRFEHPFSNWFDIESKFSPVTQQETLKSYKLAEKYGLEVHEVTEEFILTSTPRYKSSLLNYVESFPKEKRSEVVLEFLPQIRALQKDLIFRKLTHADLAFRNICVDDSDKLHLIDFEGLSTLEDGEEPDDDYLESDIESYLQEQWKAKLN